ncbi:unnamed protein product, partial [Candidula unifasciata]
MSILFTYLHWVNSVLSESGGHVDGAEDVREGQVLCQLIDVLNPGANLVMKVKASEEDAPVSYINTALDHMRGHGVKVTLQAQDIISSNVKATLDVLWALILHYGIHFIGESVQNRSAGEGKRLLLEWCQEVLNTTFDPSDQLTSTLSHGNWLVKLLEIAVQNSMQPSQNKPADIECLLGEIEHQYQIKRGIIKSNDIIEGTVDENGLMIFLSLLKRRGYSSFTTSRLENGYPLSRRSRSSHVLSAVDGSSPHSPI